MLGNPDPSMDIGENLLSKNDFAVFRSAACLGLFQGGQNNKIDLL